MSRCYAARMRYITCFVLLLFFSATLLSQAPTAREVEERLRSSTKQDRKKLLKELNLPEEMVDYYSPSDTAGIHWFYLKSSSGTSLNVLTLPCSAIMGAPILLLERSKGRWHLRDQEGMDCHYDDSANVRLVSLTSKKQYDLLLHHDCKGRGTGYVNQHTRVLKIVGSSFKQVLDEDDVIHELSLGGDGDYEESIFLPTSVNTLEQTREKTTYDKNDQPAVSNLVITRRTFHWNGQRFIATPWRRLR